MKKIFTLVLCVMIYTESNSQDQKLSLGSVALSLGDSLFCCGYTLDADTSGIEFVKNISVFRSQLLFSPKELLSTDSDSAIARFRYGRNFEKWFLKDTVLISSSVSYYLDLFLDVFELKQVRTDFDIICAIRTRLSSKPFSKGEFFPVIVSLTSKQRNGEEGILLTNGPPNVFYVRLTTDATVSVSVWWNYRSKVWELDAYPLRSWGPGYRIFAIN